MTRTLAPRLRRAAVATVLVLALGVAGCGDDDPSDASGDPTSTPTSADSSPSGDESPTEPAPSVTPAGGLELTEETSALRVPEGWEAAESLVDFASSADGPGRDNSIQLSDRPSLAGDTTIDSLAQTALQMLPKDAQAERLPDVDLAGSPAYMISYVEPGFPSVNYDVVTLRNGRSITVNFILSKKTLTSDPAIVESVLASFRWLD